MSTESRGPAPPPPNYRPEDIAGECCGDCLMNDNGRCWGYGLVAIESDHVCDSWASEPAETESARGGHPMAEHQTPPDGPRDLEDLKNAIRAVGRVADGNQARADIIGAAQRLGHADLVPDSWAEDGSLRGAAWTREQRETYNDTFTALNGAVSDAVGDDDEWCCCWVQDFTDSEVIFYYDGDLYSVGYSLEPGGAVTLDGDPVKVRPVTSYVARKADTGLEFRRQRAKDLEGACEVRRFHASDVEIREVSDGTLRFTGYASVTERAYEVGGFEETISRGAFKRTLSENPDVVLLLNHEGLPLARTKSGTLTLTEDARGLRVDADLNPLDPDVQRVRPKLERGDVDEMSFAFRATSDRWNEDYSQRRIDGLTIHKGDVSIVTYGANDASTGSIVARSDDGALELRAGKAISAANSDALTKVLNLVAAADDAVDQAQPILAQVLGVADPDADDQEPDADDARSAEPKRERSIVALPDLTTRRRERLAALRGGKR